MATTEQIDSAVHERKPSPADTRLVLDWLAGRTKPTDEDDARVARWVKRRFNHHGCTGRKCRKPGHDEDVEACRTVLQALGFMPYPRPVAAATTTTGKRKYPTKPSGRCPVCKRLVPTRKSGVIAAHFVSNLSREHCDGEDEMPVKEAAT